MSVILTEKAAAEFKKSCGEANLGEQVGLRVKIVAGGCSGFSYVLNHEPDVSAIDETKDKVTDCFGVKVVVDKKSDLYLDGTTIDYYEDLNQRGFTFTNPNAVKSCGCGSSFNA